MEGRRVNRSAKRRNPLYVIFLCLVAAVFVLLIVTIVLGAKLGSANKALDAAQSEVADLQLQLEQALSATTPGDDKLDGEDTPAVDSSIVTDPSEENKLTVGWLDLTGHSELSVLPEKLFDDYATYYTTNGVNLRAGPGTGHDKVQLVDKGTKVRAAAKDGDWTFVSVGSKFGWIRSDFLATKPPVEATSGSLTRA